MRKQKTATKPKPVVAEKLAEKLKDKDRKDTHWTEDKVGVMLRLPRELKEQLIEESRVKGDLARIILFALDHVNHKEVEIHQTRKSGLALTKPMLIHLGPEPREVLRRWADAEGVSVNAIVMSVLEEFFVHLKKNRPLHEKLRLELRAHRAL